jgi:putative SOS response-associated peptidase YedK
MARKGASKQPYCFEVGQGQVFAFAGLWDGWKDSNGQWVKTCSILTTTPNAVTSTVHDRMPVILDPKAYHLWLDPGMQNVAAISQRSAAGRSGSKIAGSARAVIRGTVRDWRRLPGVPAPMV